MLLINPVFEQHFVHVMQGSSVRSMTEAFEWVNCVTLEGAVC